MPQGEDTRARDKYDRRRFFHAVAAHGGARLLSKVASTPLDRVKVCLQVGAWPAGKPRFVVFGGVRAVLDGIIATQGSRGLFRGAATHITGTCLGNVARLSSLRTSQMWAMPGGDRRYEGFGAFARRCAFLYVAGAAALTVAYPCDLAYTCLAADNSARRRFSGFFELAQAVRREHGLLALYRGFPLCLASALPFVVIATQVHDSLAPLLLRQMAFRPEVNYDAVRPGDLASLMQAGAPAHLFPWNLLVGIAAGFTAQSATYPLDTLRRRWQLTCVGTRAQMPANLGDCAARIRAEGGARAFYAGFSANALKLVPETAALCGVYLLLHNSSAFV